MKFLLLLFLISSAVLNAGMAVYLVLNKDGHPLDYRIYMSEKTGGSARLDLYRIIKKNMLSEDDIGFLQLAREESRYKMPHSGKIISGYYVIINNGSRFETNPRYGVGFSGKSSSLAEEHARKNLSGNDWGWYQTVHGSYIIASNTFPDSKCSRAFSKCLKKANSGLDKKKCAMEKIECQGPIETKAPSKIIKSGSSGVRG